ncbi:MAG: dihydroorotate dehydrogenase-like protein [Chloroflexaceae bacterium]|nr:dihydroorotate dehydrogenase-like protein [Chloroflexaceae bacterium]NJL33786.1 dihydroorotate dehydrogenase-like protein [Chloroflexaceae bacterium]NJO04297.1 dihydroorotate dehydrogenase-like protein [Chloroflexaceae bacterium]
MMDLSTTYLGLSLKNPIVASASPISERVERVKRLEECGAAAVVMYSLFEEQIVHESLELDYYLNRGTESFPEALSYIPDLPDMGRYSVGPEVYLEQIRLLKEAVSIPVIASLNGVSTGGWIKYAQKMEQAGADAIELNIYYLPVDPELTSSELEAAYVQLVRDVRASVSIPLAVKLSPFFTALPHFARSLAEAGADGLVLFNRFYQPDFDLDTLDVVPNLRLSTSDELRLPLRWISLLYGRVNVDFALTTGVHTAQDVLKAMMAGANVAMMTSALLRHSEGHVQQVLSDMTGWMESYEYESIRQMQGSMSQRAIENPAALERTNYIKVLNSFQEVSGGPLPTMNFSLR